MLSMALGQHVQRMGNEQPLLGWIGDFLSRRQQSVIIDGAVSEAVDVTSGMVAGTAIGPPIVCCDDK